MIPHHLDWLVGPAVFLAGVTTLGFGWHRLWNCSGWWPADRRNIFTGIPLVAAGFGLIFWGIAHAYYPLFEWMCVDCRCPQ